MQADNNGPVVAQGHFQWISHHMTKIIFAHLACGTLQLNHNMKMSVIAFWFFIENKMWSVIQIVSEGAGSDTDS